MPGRRGCLSAAAIFALVNDRDRAYFGGAGKESDAIGYIDDQTRAIFGRSYAAEPDMLIRQLGEDEAIREADTLLLTVPNQLGVEYNAHVIEAILKHVGAGARLALSVRDNRSLEIEMRDHRNVVRRPFPAAGLLEDLDFREMRGEIGGRPDVIETAAAVGGLPILGAVAPPGIELFR